MTKQINLQTLTKKELIDIISNLSQHNTKESINSISIVDFNVTSNTAPLQDCERTINRLIDRHKDFATFRKRKAMLDDSMFNNSGLGVG